MIKFNKYILIFTLILGVHFTIFYSLLNIAAERSLSFKVDQNVENLILGHSHPECAYNDELINSTINLAQSGEAYFYTYLKSRKFLRDNKNIKVVFIEFTNNQVHPAMERWMNGEINIGARYSKYFSLMTFKEIFVFTRLNMKATLTQIPVSIRKNIGYIKNPSTSFIRTYGGHKKLSRKLEVDQIRKENQAIPLKNSIMSDIVEMNISYLREIIEHCKSKKIEVFLIRTPFHSAYLANKNEKLFEQILKERFSDVSFLDFSQYQLNRSELADTQHLNRWGAERYSGLFNKLLNIGKYQQSTVDSIIKIENGRIQHVTTNMN